MRKLRITFFYGKRLSFYPPDYLGQGLGASESALIVLSESLAARGHHVEVYNHCYQEGSYNGVRWRSVKSFRPLLFSDAFIAIRSADIFKNRINAPVRGIWVVDSDTPGIDVFLKTGRINLALTVSRFQEKRLFKRHPELRRIAFRSGLPFDDVLYKPYSNKRKVPGKCIYCSVPHRGLKQLLELWPTIRRSVPWAKLFITSDLGLWGLSREENEIMFGWLYKKALKLKGVKLLKRISKKDLVKHQAESEIMLYPNTVDELFCMSAAECCGVGAVPVTSARGALPERIENAQTGFLIPGKPGSIIYNRRFVERATFLLRNSNERENMSEKCRTSVATLQKDSVTFNVEQKIISMLHA